MSTSQSMQSADKGLLLKATGPPLTATHAIESRVAARILEGDAQIVGQKRIWSQRASGGRLDVERAFLPFSRKGVKRKGGGRENHGLGPPDDQQLAEFHTSGFSVSGLGPQQNSDEEDRRSHGWNCPSLKPLKDWKPCLWHLGIAYHIYAAQGRAEHERWVRDPASDPLLPTNRLTRTLPYPVDPTTRASASQLDPAALSRALVVPEKFVTHRGRAPGRAPPGQPSASGPAVRPRSAAIRGGAGGQALKAKPPVFGGLTMRHPVPPPDPVHRRHLEAYALHAATQARAALAASVSLLRHEERQPTPSEDDQSQLAPTSLALIPPVLAPEPGQLS